jgi:hypothetical protein
MLLLGRGTKGDVSERKYLLSKLFYPNKSVKEFLLIKLKSLPPVEVEDIIRRAVLEMYPQPDKQMDLAVAGPSRQNATEVNEPAVENTLPPPPQQDQAQRPTPGPIRTSSSGSSRSAPYVRVKSELIEAFEAGVIRVTLFSHLNNVNFNFCCHFVQGT